MYFLNILFAPQVVPLDLLSKGERYCWGRDTVAFGEAMVFPRGRSYAMIARGRAQSRIYF